MNKILRGLILALLLIIVIISLGAGVLTWTLLRPAGEVYPITEGPEITAPDGVVLKALQSEDQDSHKWVILVHGYRSDHSMMNEYARVYREHGYNTLQPDNRAHGSSGGDHIGMGYTDAADILAWISYIKALDPDAEIVLHGVSMGAAACMILSDNDQVPGNVRAIIADSGYTSALDYVSFKLESRTGIRLRLIPGLMSWFAGRMAGYSLKEASPIDHVRQSRHPILFIHGEKDAAVPADHAYRLYDAAAGSKDLYICKDAGHGAAAFIDPETYWNRVFAFIDTQDPPEQTPEQIPEQAPEQAAETYLPGDQNYGIIISADASDTEVYAAQVLQESLAALDGQDYPVISDDQPFEGFKFCIGKTAAYDTSDIAGKAADAYCISPFEEGLAIYGAGSRGTVYGVFSFLEKYCGYRVYSADSGAVSTTGKMVLPGQKIEYDPYFEYRNTDWRSGWMPIYSLANKLNGAMHGGVTSQQGGNIPYLGGNSHTLTTVFCAADKYFESHPEYFALHEGERNASQLCLTNEKVYEIVLEEVLSLLKDYHDPQADLQIISLSQADNPVYCTCDACKALDSANGSQAGTMISFVNRIAGAVRERGYVNVAFETLAYMHTRKAPSQVVPADNVIVTLCSFECCFSHPLDDASCLENAKFMKDLEAWSAICDRLYVWDYTTNYACTLGIFPDFGVLKENLQCFYEHGVRGVYEEGNYYVHLCDTEFGDLRTYLIAKLLEDPYCDDEALMLDFCSYHYGAGGAYIKEAIDEITANTKGHVTIYSSMTDSFDIDEEEAAAIDQLWEQAEKAADSPRAIAAIDRSKLSWRFVKAALGLREFAGGLEANRDAREALYQDLVAHDVVMINEWTGIARDFAEYEQIPVEEWEYAERYYYLQYDLNGGTDGPPNQWCNTGASWIPETVPVRQGYRFLGWAAKKNASAAEYTAGSFIYPTSDMVLYAVWEKE